MDNVKIIFGNSAFIKAPEFLLKPRGSWRSVRLRVRFGLIEHPKLGKILVDTGYSKETLSANNRSALLRTYRKLLPIQHDENHRISAFLNRQDIQVNEIQKIIITHFHADHISALRQFPNAQILASRTGYKAIMERSKWQNIRHGIFTELLPHNINERLEYLEDHKQIEAPLGLGHSYNIFGDGTCLAIPLHGHTNSHYGLCFPKQSQPLLYAVDVEWLNASLNDENKLPTFAKLVGENQAGIISSRQKVQNFEQNGGQVIFCHEPQENKYDEKLGSTKYA